MKKKVVCLMLLALSINSLVGCSTLSNKTLESGVATSEAPATTEEVKSIESDRQTTTTESTTEATKQIEPFSIKVLGELYQLYDTKNPTVSSSNLKLFSPDHIGELYNSSRCIFNLDVLLTISVKCSKELELSAALTPHNEMSSTYYGLYSNKDTQNTIFAYLPDRGEMFASFFLDPKNFSTGYYDLVILEKEKPIAVEMIKLFGVKGIQKSKKSPKDLQDFEITKTRKDPNETTETTAKKQTKKKKK